MKEFNTEEGGVFWLGIGITYIFTFDPLCFDGDFLELQILMEN